MDQIIELMAFYWADWQQTAIANTRYSAVLAALAFLIGGLIVAILKRGKIVRLMRLVMQGEQRLEKSEKRHGELLTKQKNDEVQLAGFQQQLEQATVNLQQEKNEHQSDISKKEELFIIAANEKQQEVDAINTMLDEKTLLVDRLQDDLNERESKIAQYSEAQAKISGMEKEINQSATELNTVKQLLETELNSKKEQIEQSAKINADRVLELESQLKEITVAAEVEKIQQQTLIQHNKNSQILREKLKPEVKAEPIARVENPVQQQKQQPTPVLSAEKIQVQIKHAEPLVQTVQKTVSAKESGSDKQGVVGQVVGWFSSMDKALESDKVTENNSELIEKTEKKLQNEKNQILQQKQKLEPKTEPIVNIEKTVQPQDSQPAIPTEKSRVQVRHKEPLEQKAVLAKEAKTEKKGAVGQVLGWFSSMDKVLESNEVIESEVEKVKAERKPAIKQSPISVVAISDDEGSSFSEKLAEVADTMDSFQDKFKKLFKKGVK